MTDNNTRFECAECGVGLDDVEMAEFHENNFGTDHWPVPTGDAV